MSWLLFLSLQSYFLNYRFCLLSPYFGPHFWQYHLFLCSFMFGVENFQMPKSTYTGLLHLRYVSIFCKLVLFLCICYRSSMRYIFHCLIGPFSYFFSPGLLSSMGDAGFGHHFWIASYTWPLRYHCRTSVLLLDSVASTSRWKEHFEDSNVGVSFSFTVL